MAQEKEEITPARAIVLDANILLRAVLGTRVRTLIERYADTVTLLTPRSCVDDAREYLPALCIERGWSVAPVMELFDALLTSIHVVDHASLLIECASQGRTSAAAALHHRAQSAIEFQGDGNHDRAVLSSCGNQATPVVRAARGCVGRTGTSR